MTTIAYRDGILACDSMVSAAGLHLGSTSKIWRLPSGVIALAGSLATTHRVAMALAKSDEEELKKIRQECQGDDGFDGILVTEEGLFSYDSLCYPMPLNAEFIAEGSGIGLAMGAMGAGVGAKEAVEIACRYDSRSHGPVIAVDARDELSNSSQIAGARLIGIA